MAISNSQREAENTHSVQVRPWTPGVGARVRTSPCIHGRWIWGLRLTRPEPPSQAGLGGTPGLHPTCPQPPPGQAPSFSFGEVTLVALAVLASVLR